MIGWYWLGNKMKQLSGFNPLIRSAAVLMALALVGLQPLAVSAQSITVLDSTLVKQGNLSITLNATGSLAPVEELNLSFELSTPVTSKSW